MEGPRVLILGGTEFIGKELLERLEAQACEPGGNLNSLFSKLITNIKYFYLN